MAESPRPDTSSDRSPSRSKIVRDVLVFQVKLWLEGLKDFVLMPLSAGAALIDLVFRSKGRRGALYSVMKLGDRFERWVHLYGALEGPASEDRAPEPEERSLHEILNEAADGLEEQARRPEHKDSRSTS